VKSFMNSNKRPPVRSQNRPLANSGTPVSDGVPKARTGIEGFDEITNGGLPRGRTTLLEGGPGSGKTIMALQSLVHGARAHDEPGIFVAFEERSELIMANAKSFGWEIESMKRKLFFLDAQPAVDFVQAGNFDLGGMLAALDLKVREIKARRIVLDAIDVVLALLNDQAAERRELYRLHEWLLARRLTAIVTAKTSNLDKANQPQLSFMEFMVECSVILNHEVIEGVSQRNVRVVKYRGSAFAENESPFLIGNKGLEVAAAPRTVALEALVTTERVSSGVTRLDAMLGGGYFRGATVLITGFPGTAKSTLSGAFAQAACQRGERTLFVSFDSSASELVRNLASVRINLGRFIKKGVLSLITSRTITGSAEIHMMRIKNLAQEQGARCLVIDPVSALSKRSNEVTAHSVAERLIDWTKIEGITTVCTSLLDESGLRAESTPMEISTIADTWIHLDYLMNAGERNRSLSIIKSRGTAHSNQVRELILSDLGVTLADAYTAGGEVVMGTMRWEKERAVKAAREESEALEKKKQATLDFEQADLELRLRAVQRDLEIKRAEKRASTHSAANQTIDRAKGRTRLRELRGVD
jgi:circadian clock protein KaiC